MKKGVPTLIAISMYSFKGGMLKWMLNVRLKGPFSFLLQINDPISHTVLVKEFGHLLIQGFFFIFYIVE